MSGTSLAHLNCHHDDEKKEAAHMTNYLFMGHVDSGKSTLLGRMLCSLQANMPAQMASLEQAAYMMAKSKYAFASDLAKVERERGVTIQARAWPLQCDDKHLCLIDTPGHRDFLKNAVTYMFTGDVAVYVFSGNRYCFEFELITMKHHLTLLRSYGIPVMMFMNKADDNSYEVSPEVTDRLIHSLQAHGYTYVSGSEWLERANSDDIRRTKGAEHAALGHNYVALHGCATIVCGSAWTGWNTGLEPTAPDLSAKVADKRVTGYTLLELMLAVPPPVTRRGRIAHEDEETKVIVLKPSVRSFVGYVASGTLHPGDALVGESRVGSLAQLRKDYLVGTGDVPKVLQGTRAIQSYHKPPLLNLTVESLQLDKVFADGVNVQCAGPGSIVKVTVGRNSLDRGVVLGASRVDNEDKSEEENKESVLKPSALSHQVVPVPKVLCDRRTFRARLHVRMKRLTEYEHFPQHLTPGYTCSMSCHGSSTPVRLMQISRRLPQASLTQALKARQGTSSSRGGVLNNRQWLDERSGWEVNPPALYNGDIAEVVFLPLKPVYVCMFAEHPEFGRFTLRDSHTVGVGLVQGVHTPEEYLKAFKACESLLCFPMELLPLIVYYLV